MLGFARPDSICDSVDLPTPAAAASSDSDRRARARWRCRLSATTRARSPGALPASSIVLIYRTMRSVRDHLVRQAIAMAVAVGAVGIAFGALAADGGLSLAKALALSGLVYGGSAQLAALGVAVEGGSGGASVAAGLLLSARNVAFGVALAALLPRRLGRRLAASQLVIDQSAAAALAQPRRDRAWRAFWLTGVWVLALWLAGTAAGWALTGAIDIETYGIDAAIPALFLALLAPRMRNPAEAATALAGGAIALALVPFTAPGIPILAASAGVVAGLVVARRRAAR
jgi:predicted branched-subunit amino acid permease